MKMEKEVERKKENGIHCESGEEYKEMESNL